MFEKTGIALRRTHKHRDFVERNPGARLFRDAPGDLHALTPLARCREQADVADWSAFRRAAARKQVPPQRDEVAVALLLEHLDIKAERRQMLERLDVAKRH